MASSASTALTGSKPAAERLAQYQHIGVHVFHDRKASIRPVRQSPVCISSAMKQHVGVFAILFGFGQVALIGHHHAGLALDGLYEEASHLFVPAALSASAFRSL